MISAYDNHTSLIMDIRNNLHIIEELIENSGTNQETQQLILKNIKLVNYKLLELSHSHNSLKNFLPYLSHSN